MLIHSIIFYIFAKTNINIMKEQIKNYEIPEVELVEVYVEKGFGGSTGDAEGGDGTGGDNEDDF